MHEGTRQLNERTSQFKEKTFEKKEQKKHRKPHYIEIWWTISTIGILELYVWIPIVSFRYWVWMAVFREHSESLKVETPPNKQEKENKTLRTTFKHYPSSLCANTNENHYKTYTLSTSICRIFSRHTILNYRWNLYLNIMTTFLTLISFFRT